jgi:hypothetical protein
MILFYILFNVSRKLVPFLGVYSDISNPNVKSVVIELVPIMMQMSLIVSLVIVAKRLILIDIDQSQREKRGSD